MEETDDREFSVFEIDMCITTLSRLKKLLEEKNPLTATITGMTIDMLKSVKEMPSVPNTSKS